MKKTVPMIAYVPIVLMLSILFSSSIFSGLIPESTSLNIRSTDLELLLINTNAIFQEVIAQNGEEEQSTGTEESDQDQPPPPPDCEKTTAGCPQPEDEVEGTVAPPSEPSPTGGPPGAQLPTADTDGEPSTTDVVPPPGGGTVIPYTCSTTFYDPPKCVCHGINDCNDLRKSGECKTGTEPTGSGETGKCPWKGKS